MSRGLGKTQKRVLRILGTKKWKSMEEIRDQDKQHYKYDDCNYASWPGSGYMAIYRAIKTLEKRGLVETNKGVIHSKSIMGPYSASLLYVRKVKR